MIKDSADMDTGMNREEDEGCYHGVILKKENHFNFTISNGIINNMTTILDGEHLLYM